MAGALGDLIKRLAKDEYKNLDLSQAKVFLVLLLSGIHGLLVRWVRDFAADRNRNSQKFYRVINEIPAILLVGIVILAVVKPF